MDCTYIKNNLFAIVENRLQKSEIALAREHAAGCKSCSALLSSFSSFIDVIGKDRQVEINPFLAARMLQKLEAHSAIDDHGFLFRMARMLQPVLAATLILLAVLTGFFAGLQGQNISHDKAQSDLKVMKTELFISELNDEDKTLELYK